MSPQVGTQTPEDELDRLAKLAAKLAAEGAPTITSSMSKAIGEYRTQGAQSRESPEDELDRIFNLAEEKKAQPGPFATQNAKWFADQAPTPAPAPAIKPDASAVAPIGNRPAAAERDKALQLSTKQPAGLALQPATPVPFNPPQSELPNAPTMQPGVSVARAMGLDDTIDPATGEAPFPSRVANALGEMASHPLRTGAGMAWLPVEAAITLNTAAKEHEQRILAYTRGEDPSLLPRTVTERDAQIAAAQLATLALAGPIAKAIGVMAAPFIGVRAGAVAGATATGAGVGAIYSPKDPAVGATIGAGLGAIHATIATRPPPDLSKTPERLLTAPGGARAPRPAAPEPFRTTSRVVPEAAAPSSFESPVSVKTNSVREALAEIKARGADPAAPVESASLAEQIAERIRARRTAPPESVEPPAESVSSKPNPTAGYSDPDPDSFIGRSQREQDLWDVSKYAVTGEHDIAGKMFTHDDAVKAFARMRENGVTEDELSAAMDERLRKYGVTDNGMERVRERIARMKGEQAPAVTSSPVETVRGAIAEGKKAAAATKVPAAVADVAGVRMEPLANIDVEPERFQYKLDTNEHGVTRALEGVKWNDDLAGVVSVWRDPEDGRLKIVNGHHRYDLAMRSGRTHLAIRELDAPNALEARSRGALINIADGKGTAVDAAKLFRDTKITPADMAAYGVNAKGAIARDGVALAQLHPSLFNKVVNGDLSIPRGAVIGGAGLAPEQQLALSEMLDQREAKGKRLTNEGISELVRFVRSAGTETTTQDSLFGEEQLTASLAPEKAELSAWVKDKLGKDRKLSAFLTKAGRASRIETAGIGKIDTEAASSLAEQSGRMEEVYNKLSTMSGPVADALTEAARSWVKGGDRNAIRSQLYDSVADAVRSVIGGGEAPRAARVPEGREGTAAAVEPPRVSAVDTAGEGAEPPAFVDPSQSGFFDRDRGSGSNLRREREKELRRQGRLEQDLTGSDDVSRGLSQLRDRARAPEAEKPVRIDDVASKARTARDRAGMGVNKQNLADTMSANVYKGEISKTIVKEAIQNAIDSLRERPGGGGEIIVRMDRDAEGAPRIYVSDNGSGMTPDVATKEYLNAFESNKPSGSSGALGIAKAALFRFAKPFHTDTVADVPGEGRVRTVIRGTGQDWIDGNLEVSEQRVPSTGAGAVPTGTRYAIKLDLEALGGREAGRFDSARYFIAELQRHSRIPGVKIIDRTGHGADLRDRAANVAQGFDLASKEPEASEIPDAPVKTVTVPGATVDIYVKERAGGYGNYATARILNNGYFQFDDSFIWGPNPPKLWVDVHTTVGVNDARYPFTIDREKLKDATSSGIGKAIEAIGMGAEAREVDDLVRSLASAPEIAGVEDAHVYATDAGVPAEFAKELAERGYIEKFASWWKDAGEAVMYELADAAGGSKLYRAHMGGIGLGQGYLGINILREKLFERAAKLGLKIRLDNRNLLLLNPYVVTLDAISGRPMNAPFADAKLLADRTWGTLIHELAHQNARGHGEDFSGVLTRMLGAAGRIQGRFIGRLDDIWEATLSDDTFRRDADALVNYWKANANKFKEYNGHEQRLEPAGDNLTGARDPAVSGRAVGGDGGGSDVLSLARRDRGRGDAGLPDEGAVRRGGASGEEGEASRRAELRRRDERDRGPDRSALDDTNRGGSGAARSDEQRGQSASESPVGRGAAGERRLSGEGSVRRGEGGSGEGGTVRDELPGADARQLSAAELYRLEKEKRGLQIPQREARPAPKVEEALPVTSPDEPDVDEKLPLPPDHYAPAVRRVRLQGTTIVDAHGEPMVVYYHTASDADNPELNPERRDYAAPWMRKAPRNTQTPEQLGWTEEKARSLMLEHGPWTPAQLDRQIAALAIAKHGIRPKRGLDALKAIIERQGGTKPTGPWKSSWQPESWWKRFDGLADAPAALRKPIGIQLHGYEQVVDARKFGGPVHRHAVYAMVRSPLRLADGGAPPWTYDHVRAAMIESGHWTDAAIAKFERSAAESQRYRSPLHGVDALAGLLKKYGKFDGLVFRNYDAVPELAPKQLAEDAALKRWIESGSEERSPEHQQYLEARDARKGWQEKHAQDSWIALDDHQVEPARPRSQEEPARNPQSLHSPRGTNSKYFDRPREKRPPLPELPREGGEPSIVDQLKSSRGRVGERDLFGNEPEPSREDQTSMFGKRAGSEASRSLEGVERVARAELDRLNLERKNAHGPQAVRILRRIAELEKLLNRDKAITSQELKTRAGAGENEDLFGAEDSEQRTGVPKRVKEPRPNNPFRAKAAAARERYEKLSGRESAHDKGMAQSFPLGAGFGRPGKAGEQRIESSVRRAKENVDALQEARYLEAQADAFDEGKINAQGHSMSPDAWKRSEKRAAYTESRDERIAAAKELVGDKERWQVPAATWADSTGNLGGGARRLMLSDHREAVEKAIAAGESVPREVLADYPDLQKSRGEDTTLYGFADPFTAAAHAFYKVGKRAWDKHQLKRLGVSPYPMPEPTGMSHSQPQIRPFDLARKIKATLNPDTLGKDASATAGQLRGHEAVRFRQHAQSVAALRALEVHIDRQPRAKQIELWKDAEHGTPTGDKFVDAMLDVFREITDQRTQKLITLGKLRAERSIENYIGRFWTTENKKESAISFVRSIFAKRPFEGPKSFLKFRSLENFTDGLHAGLIPPTYNFVTSQLAKIAEMDRLITSALELQKEAKAGRAKAIATGYSPPRDGDGNPWVKIDREGNDPAFSVWSKPPIVRWEGVDKIVYGKLEHLIAKLGVAHERKVSVPGAFGFAEGDKRIVTKFGGPEGTLMHELGHILDARYKLKERIISEIGNAPRRTVQKGKTKGKSMPDYKNEHKDARARRTQLRDELRNLANLRRESLVGNLAVVPETKNLGKSDRAYLHSWEEKMANMVEAYIAARPRFKDVAPGIFEIFDKIIDGHPELHPLRDIEPSLSRDSHAVIEELPGPMKVGEWYAPRNSAAVWHNHLSRGLRGNPIYDALTAPGAAATQILLGASGFHGTVIATEGMFSDMVLAAEHAMSLEGKGAARSVGRVLASPVTSAVSAIVGSLPRRLQTRRTQRLGAAAFATKILEEYRTPGSRPELARVLEAMMRGGFRGTEKSEIWNGERSQALKRAVQKALYSDKKLTQAWNASKIPLDALFAGVELLSAPLMSKYVPLMKTAATYHAVAKRMGELPSTISEDDFNREMWDIVKEMDYRFGQVIYENHFINNVAKHLAQAMFLAPGWTFGTAVLAARGIRDVGMVPNRVYRRARGRAAPGEPILGRSGKYWVAAVVGTMLLNALLTKMSSGENPGDGEDGWKDFFAFRDGTFDIDGNPNRHTIPGYLMHDIYGWSHHPMQTFRNKLSPFFSFASRVAQNRTYQGDMIYDEDELKKFHGLPYLTKKGFTQIADEAGKELALPLSAQNYLEGRKRDETGPGEVARNAFGVTPAKREFVRTDAQNRMTEIQSRRGHTAASPDEKAARDDRADVLSGLRTGTDAAERMSRALERGELTGPQLNQLFKRAGILPLTERYKTLTAAEALDVFSKANPWERAMFANILEKKLQNAEKKQQ